MWRFLVGPCMLLLMAAAVACGGGADERLQACPINRDTMFVDPQPAVSLQEARKRSQFGVGLPGELPPGVSLASVVIEPDAGCPDKRIRMVQLAFSGPGYSFTIMEHPEGVGTVVDSEPIQVNGGEGRVYRRSDSDGKQLVSFHWADGKRGYSAFAFLTGGLTEQTFIQILESIAE